MLVLQNYYISSGKLFLLSNEATDMERAKMRKAGIFATLLCVAIRERRDLQPLRLGHWSYSCLRQPDAGPPAINPVGKAVLEPILFLLLPRNKNRPEAGKDIAQISSAI